MKTSLCIAFSLEKTQIGLIKKNDRTLMLESLESHAVNVDNWATSKAVWQTILKNTHSATPVYVSIPHQKTMTQYFTLDKAFSDSEVMQFLKGRAQHTFGFDFETLCIDYESHAINDQQQKIHAVATHKKLITTLLASFSHHRIKLQTVDVDDLAIARFEQSQASLTVINHTLSQENPLDYKACLGLSLWHKT